MKKFVLKDSKNNFFNIFQYFHLFCTKEGCKLNFKEIANLFLFHFFSDNNIYGICIANSSNLYYISTDSFLDSCLYWTVGIESGGIEDKTFKGMAKVSAFLVA